jgi:PAS domain S-box-containing protein
LDYPREEFIGKTLWDIGAFKQIEASKAAFRKLQDKEYVRYENLPLETRSGRLVNVEFVSNVYGVNGESVIQCNIRDITARRRAEEELHKSEERFSKAFRLSPLAITISTEREGRYLDVNEAFLLMLGYKRGDVIGRAAAELSFWARPSHRLEMLRKLQEGGRVTGLHTQYTTSEGEIREAEVSAELIELEGQSCVLAITRDITEGQRLEAQFRQAQKMEAVGRLAGGVAHDFNNLLSVIIGYSDLSLDLVASGSRVSQNLEQIKVASNRAVLITRQLLAYSRQQVVFPKILDLNEVVQNLTSMLQRMVREDITISFRPIVPIGSINADPGPIEQVLMNLVVNARDAMPGGGEIVIETGHAELDEHYVARHPGSHAGQHVVLVVSDTGCGMEEEIKSQIFEPFFTTKGIGQGTGLGLSTVYGIVKQTEGSIWVYSEPGKGTTFKIYFPRVAGKPEHLVQSHGEAEFPGGSETILVVEDDEPLRDLVVRMLQDAGYQVIEAKNAETALDIVKASKAGIDLLLTDAIMPGKSGTELLQQAKLIRPELHSLLMSGYTGDLVALRGERLPQAAFLEKPFTRRSLLRKVRSALRSESAK